MISGRRIFILLYAASGAAALVYEVTWTRLLTLQLGHTVAAASTVLAAFMGGLAVGAWLARTTRARRGEDTKNVSVQTIVRGRVSSWLGGSGTLPDPAALRTYASLELIVAVTAIALPFALRATVPALAWAYADGAAPARFALVRIVISLALL